MSWEWHQWGPSEIQQAGVWTAPDCTPAAEPLKSHQQWSSMTTDFARIHTYTPVHVDTVPFSVAMGKMTV